MFSSTVRRKEVVRTHDFLVEDMYFNQLNYIQICRIISIIIFIVLVSNDTFYKFKHSLIG